MTIHNLYTFDTYILGVKMAIFYSIQFWKFDVSGRNRYIIWSQNFTNYASLQIHKIEVNKAQVWTL